MRYDKLIKSLTSNGYKVSYFENSKDAAGYLINIVQDVSVGFGDSATLSSMNLAELLAKRNIVIDPSDCSGKDFIEVAKKTLTTDVFFTSVNAISETGEMVNIDSTGNRVSGSLFGHKKVFFVLGTNKIEPTLDKAIYRAQNVAAPLNAKRFGFKTPCAVKGDKCYNCSSPDRICNTMNIYLKKLKDTESEIILINEDLGM